MSDKPTVLLVEDDHLILDATAQSLSDGGCLVRPASSYQEALDALDDCPSVSVLVTDIMLDGAASGLTLIDEVRARKPGVGIIVLSGEVRPARDRLPDNALFCTKPCAPGALLELVNECRDW